MEYPLMYSILREFESGPAITDPESAAASAVRENVSESVARGARIAITAGSRGITGIVPVLRGIVAECRSVGARPFLVPAMGSHGGATADGQVQVLGRLGITPETIGAPVESSMETVEIGRIGDMPVYVDRIASEADGIVVVNRVKPHTIFSGPYQSGLMKMLLIGMGNHDGARAYHRAALGTGFEQIVRQAGALVLGRCNVIAGVALIENAREELVEVEGLHPGDFVRCEPDLLARAERLMPMLPPGSVDLLIVDEMGKNISGTGMDTNVLGRKHWCDYGTGEHLAGGPRRVFVRDLSLETGGNAAGIGLADVTLDRLVEKIDRGATITNSITATRPRGAMIPMSFSCDRDAINAMFASAGIDDPGQARIMRIRNTRFLERVVVSKAFLDSVRDDASMIVESGPSPMVFDRTGMLA